MSLLLHNTEYGEEHCVALFDGGCCGADCVLGVFVWYTVLKCCNCMQCNQAQATRPPSGLLSPPGLFSCRLTRAERSGSNVLMWHVKWEWTTTLF